MIDMVDINIYHRHIQARRLHERLISHGYSTEVLFQKIPRPYPLHFYQGEPPRKTWEYGAGNWATHSGRYLMRYPYI
jgi:hypothetical protein